MPFKDDKSGSYAKPFDRFPDEVRLVLEKASVNADEIRVRIRHFFVDY